MKISVNCPSYRRPNVKTLDYLPFCKVWVDEVEYQDYIEANKGFETNIISVPSGIQGNLCRIRNYILDTEFKAGNDVVVIVDDDLKGVYMWCGTDAIPYSKNIKITADRFLEMIAVFSQMCDDFGFKMWGVNPNGHNKMAYMPYTPFGTASYIGGPFQAFLKNPLRYDERLPLKEDYDMSLQHCNKYRGNFRVNFLYYEAEQSVQAGGCASYRNRQKEQQQLDMLIRKWGSDIVKIDKSKNPNSAVGFAEKKYEDYNPIIKIPIKGV